MRKDDLEILIIQNLRRIDTILYKKYFIDTCFLKFLKTEIIKFHLTK